MKLYILYDSRGTKTIDLSFFFIHDTSRKSLRVKSVWHVYMPCWRLIEESMWLALMIFCKKKSKYYTYFKKIKNIIIFRIISPDFYQCFIRAHIFIDDTLCNITFPIFPAYLRLQLLLWVSVPRPFLLHYLRSQVSFSLGLVANKSLRWMNAK